MKLLYSIYKEYKVLTRDRAGLAITFIMPTVLNCASVKATSVLFSSSVCSSVSTFLSLQEERIKRKEKTDIIDFIFFIILIIRDCWKL